MKTNAIKAHCMELIILWCMYVIFACYMTSTLVHGIGCYDIHGRGVSACIFVS